MPPQQRALQAPRVPPKPHVGGDDAAVGVPRSEAGAGVGTPGRTGAVAPRALHPPPPRRFGYYRTAARRYGAVSGVAKAAP